MVKLTAADDLHDAEFFRTNLRGAWFRDAGMAGVTMRGVDLSGADLDGEMPGLRIWGVEVEPLITAELDRRHPERAVLSATEPDAIRTGWARLEAMWDATMRRVEAMPPGTVDVSVHAEWSFAQTLRHLVMATDAWLGQAVLGREKPFHPLGVLFWEWQGHEEEIGLVPPGADVPFADVLATRADRVAMVREFLADVTQERLDARCGAPPWGRATDRTVLRCLRVIFSEEWNHHRYAVRDLDAIEAGAAG